MTALDRAFPLEQVHDVAVAVAEDLYLHVARCFDVPLHEQGVVTERGDGLAPGRLDGGRQVVCVAATMRIPLPPPPAEALTRTG